MRWWTTRRRGFHSRKGTKGGGITHHRMQINTVLAGTRKHQKNCGGTRVLVPGHQNSGPFKLTTVFYCNLENGHQENQFVFFLKCIDVFLTFPVFFQNIASTNVSTPSRNPQKNEGAPEFWCPGTRTLVPFPAENRFFVLISRMGIRNINFSFFLSVFICS